MFLSNLKLFCLDNKKSPCTKENVGVIGIIVDVTIIHLAGSLKTALDLMLGLCDILKNEPIIDNLKPMCDGFIGEGDIMKVIIEELDQITKKIAKPEDNIDQGWIASLFAG